jgi:hypothetical protein
MTMGIAQERKISSFAAAVLSSLSFSLSVCTPATAGSSLMDARAQRSPPKTSIFDPPPRREPAMTADELLKLKQDLAAARERHAPNAKAHTATTRPAKP